MSSHQEQYPLSVVIPTLGGDSLAKTIEYLNRGTVVPSEILVCIPEEESSRADYPLFDNVKIVSTTCRGQVSQRAVGFRQANHELVLQLDDDISVRETCVQNLVACIMDADNVAVGPKLYDIETGKYHSFLTPAAEKMSWFERILFWVLNGSRGYEPGRIGRAGVCMGVPEEPGNWSDLGWLPGGCVLHRRKNLILTDYYPFRGKAFAEDLFHSVLLKQNGVRLMRCGSAECDVHFTSSETFNLFSFPRWYLAYARALQKVVSDTGGSSSCLYLYLFLNVVGQVARRIFTAKPKSWYRNTEANHDV